MQFDVTCLAWIELRIETNWNDEALVSMSRVVSTCMVRIDCYFCFLDCDFLFIGDLMFLLDDSN